MLSTGRISLLAVVLASGLGISNAERGTLTVTEDDVEFTVIGFNDGRNRPYRLKFSQDDTRSLFTFNSRELVTTIRVGAETYGVSRCRIPSRECAS